MASTVINEDGFHTYTYPYQRKLVSGNIATYYYQKKYMPTYNTPTGRPQTDLDSELIEQIRVFRLTNTNNRACYEHFHISRYMLKKYINAIDF